MASPLETIEVTTDTRTELRDVTAQVQAAVERSGIREGVAYVYCPHTTAGIAINENSDPAVRRDFLMLVNREIRRDDDFHHAEGNSDAHIKSILTGASEAIPVTEGRLALGTWQGVFFCEYDGPRRRRFQVRVIGA